MGRLSFLRVKKIWPNMLLYSIAIFFTLGATHAVFSEEDHDRAKMLREQGDILPLSEILQKAEQEHPGQMLEVELEEEAGKIIYELELLDDQGRVWEMKYDAKNGILLSSEAEK